MILFHRVRPKTCYRIRQNPLAWLGIYTVYIHINIYVYYTGLVFWTSCKRIIMGSKRANILILNSHSHSHSNNDKMTLNNVDIVLSVLHHLISSVWLCWTRMSFSCHQTVSFPLQHVSVQQTCHTTKGTPKKKHSNSGSISGSSVDGSEILHQLRLVVYPIIYRVLYIQSVVVSRISEPSTVW